MELNQVETVNLDQLENFRDTAFIMINNKLEIGDRHDLIFSLIDDEDLADELISARFGMGNSTEIPFCAGYIYGKDAILIDNSLEHMTLDEAKQILLKEGYTRIFTAPAEISGYGEMTRIAKSN